MKQKPNITIAITFHNEGLIAHKTLRNIEALILNVEKENAECEIIANIDNGDELTKRYIDQYTKESKWTFSVYENEFGDPAKSRNFLVSKAKGDYVALIDGDDIISEEWLAEGYKIISETKEKCILHVEYEVTFGPEEYSPIIWKMENSYDDERDTEILFGRNRWCAGILAKRETLEKCEYKEATKGFGYEDWTFNADSRARGYLHKVVPNSVLFYRVKTDGIYNRHRNQNVVAPYSELFETERIKSGIASGKLKISNAVKLRSNLPAYRKIIRTVRDMGGQIPRVRDYLAKDARKKYEKGNPISEVVKCEWKKLNSYDGSIYLSESRQRNYTLYSAESDYLGKIYINLISQIRKNPDYLFLPPKLNIGGTEKVIVNYANAFAKAHPSWHIVVLSSIPKNNPYDIPNNVDFVGFYELMEGLPGYDWDFMLSRLIIQTKVKRLHVIHNEFIYNWLRNHKILLKENGYKVFVSQFMNEYNDDPELKVGFVDPYISEAYSVITKIFSDNSHTLDEMERMNAFERKKLILHRQPINSDVKVKKKYGNKNGKIRILWASRVFKQKRPDILVKIAKKLDSKKYEIDVYGRIQAPCTEKMFSNISTIKYKGAYSGFFDLDLDSYDIFLYTSQIDGMPNVILEASAAGLPIVSSNIGGIKDLIKDGLTGRLIEMEDIDGYVEAIEEISESKDCGEKMAKKAQESVRTGYSWEQFIESVKKDIN